MPKAQLSNDRSQSMAQRLKNKTSLLGKDNSKSGEVFQQEKVQDRVKNQTKQPQQSQPAQAQQPQQPQQPQQAQQSQQNTAASDQEINQETNQQTNQQNAQQDQQMPPVNAQLEKSRIAPGMYRPLPEEVVAEWQAPSRPFKKHNKKYFSTVTVIALLVSLILGFAGQLVAVTVVISIMFLVYVLSVIPPANIGYSITTYGIRIEKNLYYWEELGNFWMDKKYGQNLAQIATLRFPGRITLMLGDQDPELIKLILSEVLLNKKPEPSLYDKTSDWLQDKISLDDED